MQSEVLILAGARTPMGAFQGSLRGLTEVELGAHAVAGVLARAGVPAGSVDHVVIGNALQAGRDAVYGARHVALKAGLPAKVPALTVNRLCGSGIQAIVSGAQMIQLGEAETVIAGGIESMSQAPHILRGMREGVRLGETTLEDALTTALLDGHCGLMMAQTADLLGRESGITRAQADAYAVLSQSRAAEAMKQQKPAQEIVPITVRRRKEEIKVSGDEHPRPGTTMEALGSLPAVFETELVTAGNASGIVDGAAAVVISSAKRVRDEGLPWLGRVLGWHYEGVDPRRMGLGPVPAIRGVLRKAGLGIESIGLFEINEAFAAQYLAVEQELNLDRDRVNVNGGAIALGHPLGATGTRLVLTLLLEMGRRAVRYGIASACIGGGQGIAILVEGAQGER